MASDDCPAESILASNIDQVLKASYRAADLVKQILTFSRLDKTERMPLQPSVIIKEACKLLRASLPSSIDIQLDIDAESDFILADPIQIHQILMNLCTNAFHAMEDTGGNLRI
jgi:signal transduction histidine kinase